MARQRMFTMPSYLWYTDAIDVGSKDNGDCAPAINEGNIDGWVADFDNGVWRLCGGISDDSRERAATPVVAWGSGSGSGDVLDPALLSGTDKEDANDNNNTPLATTVSTSPLQRARMTTTCRLPLLTTMSPSPTHQPWVHQGQ